jgi:hypothetical protein
MSGGGGGGGMDMNGDGGGGDADVGKTVVVAGSGGSGATSTVVTFTVETLLYTAALTASCWFASHYVSFLRIPALAFMFVDTVSVMASAHAVATILVFSIRPKAVGGAFSDGVLAEVAQGFAVVSSLLWLVVLLCMFIDVPRIAAVPGFPASSSAIALAVVLGLSVVVPLLALVITYAAVPAGSGNSLLFNGSTVGAACLLFFVTISFGNGGVMKCYPNASSYSTLSFCVCVISYWGILLILEVGIWTFLGNNGDHHKQYFQNIHLGWIEINVWRIAGCLINIMIVATSRFYADDSLNDTILFAGFAVVLLHVPLIITLKFDWFGTDYEDTQMYEQANMGGQSFPPDKWYPSYDEPAQMGLPYGQEPPMYTQPNQPNAQYQQSFQEGLPNDGNGGVQPIFHPVYPVNARPAVVPVQSSLHKIGISNLFPSYPTISKNALSTEPRHRRNLHTRFL